MPAGTEKTPGRYAKLVSKELVAIAALRGKASGRAIAEWMNQSEKYVRDRIDPNPIRSWTLTDIVNFCRLAKIDPESFLGDPTETRRAVEAVPNVIEADFGVRGRRQNARAAHRRSRRDDGEQPGDI